MSKWKVFWAIFGYAVIPIGVYLKDGVLVTLGAFIVIDVKLDELRRSYDGKRT